MEKDDLVKQGIADRRENIVKGFSDNDIEKSKHGVYGDTPENKKLNRVGQEYGNASKKEEPKRKGDSKPSEEGQKTLDDHAKTTDSETLKKVIANSKSAPELVAAAKRELTSRGETHAHNEGGENKPDSKQLPKNNDNSNEIKIGKIKSYKMNGETFEVVGHEGESVLLVESDGDTKRKSLNFLKQNGAQFSDKSGKSKEPNYVLKNYKKDLKDAVKSMKSDLEEIDISELHDVAESLAYNAEIKTYLNSKGYNAKTSIVRKIQDDMEMML